MIAEYGKPKQPWEDHLSTLFCEIEKCTSTLFWSTMLERTKPNPDMMGLLSWQLRTYCLPSTWFRYARDVVVKKVVSAFLICHRNKHNNIKKYRNRYILCRNYNSSSKHGAIVQEKTWGKVSLWSHDRRILINILETAFREGTHPAGRVGYVKAGRHRTAGHVLEGVSVGCRVPGLSCELRRMFGTGAGGCFMHGFILQEDHIDTWKS